ncbi:MAG: 50S ribosomal protein L21 [Legionellales bacterium]|nr:50S ribosomal protein L21 [Legionellales bacterium]|tara:strand:- start:616 stop:924 length:309 start_codon:yes stop_codon:yes gene_type:complete
MYAIIKSGGKQYRVKVGQVVRLEKLDVELGQSVSFDEVMLVANGDKVTVGSPTVASAKVNGEVVSHGRGKKVTIIKMKRRKKYRRKQGHRQSFTEVKISEIA